MNNGLLNSNKGKWLSNVAGINSDQITLLFYEDDKVKDFLVSESVDIYTEDANVQVVNQDEADGAKAIKVNFEIAEFPCVRFDTKDFWNWGTGNCLSFDVTNLASRSQTIYMKVEYKDADETIRGTISRVTIPPNSTKTAYMSLNSKSLDLGMRFFPPTVEGLSCGYAWGDVSIDASRITALEFSKMDNKSIESVIFSNIKTAPDPTLSPTYLDGIVDQFGQFTGKDWTGKIKSTEDLLASKNFELQEIEAGNPALPKTPKYGGWADGPKLHATGYFRAEKYKGKWSLVDPEGYLFFATGLDIVRFLDLETWITGRENMFNPVPEIDGPLKEHYEYITEVNKPPLGLTEGWIFNYYTANLQRKYGTNYKEEWKNMSIKRFKHWGFSMIGNWSEPELFFGKGEQNKIAYVANGEIKGNFATIADEKSYWRPIADPYDPEFRESTKRLVDKLVAYGIQNDPWCMGIYVDNELNWGNNRSVKEHYKLVTNAFLMDSSATDSYAKRAFISKLKTKYNNNISDLNALWGTELDSWATLELPYTVPYEYSVGIEADLSNMLKMIASEYFSIVSDELNKAMPNIMYLGSRFADWGVTIEVEEACGKYADVVSYNAYKVDLRELPWIHAEELDIPCMIGEFHFGSADGRMFSPGFIAAENQKERGTLYQNYIKALLENPCFVGAQWFEYVDQPVTGRALDGENYNAGFVDVADVPYDKLVDAAKEIHSQVYSIRYGT